MKFWKQRRGTEPQAIDGAAARELAPSLEPVRLYLADRVVVGSMPADDRRVSDLLVSGDHLRVQEDDGTWASYPLAELVVVEPPAHASLRRIHRAKRRVELVAAPYRIVGTTHLPPGTQLDPFVLRTGRPAIAVTNAWVHRDDGSIDDHLDVAIVTVDRISFARELLGPI